MLEWGLESDAVNPPSFFPDSPRLYDRLAQDLYTEICRIPLIDAHSLLDPHRPTARHLEDLLGHPVYTELAHAAGMEEEAVGPNVESRDRMRGILYQMAYFDNTTAYQWFLELARALLDFQGDRLGLADATWLCDRAEKLMARPDWEAFVLRRSNLVKVLVPRKFDDPLTGFDTKTYVPYLNADDLVFHLDQPEVRQRLATATGIEVGDVATLRQAITKVFEQFKRNGAKACAVSLPSDFRPHRGNEADENGAIQRLATGVNGMSVEERNLVASSSLWALAEQCRTGDVPFGLTVGVRRGDRKERSLFDLGASLLTYAELFSAFPEVTFLVSVPSSQQNEELVRFSAFFPNVVTNGHWWNANVPRYIESDLRARLQAVPKIKQIGYFSDARTLEFALPRYSMYRRILARVLADDYVRTRRCNEVQAVQLARMLLYDNVKRIFDV